MTKKAKRNVVALVVVVVAGLGLGFFAHARASKGGATKDNGSSASVAAKRGKLAIRVSATGSVEPEYTVEIKSKASGTVDTVTAQEGDLVEKDKLLVKIDPVVERRKVTQAEADLRIAEAQRAS